MWLGLWVHFLELYYKETGYSGQRAEQVCNRFLLAPNPGKMSHSVLQLELLGGLQR